MLCSSSLHQISSFVLRFSSRLGFAKQEGGVPDKAFDRCVGQYVDLQISMHRDLS